ncbi:MAG: hypothetical protein RIC07_16280 [Coleofasciculus sp. E1-EBD-02]|jgi:hypothetical protein
MGEARNDSSETRPYTVNTSQITKLKVEQFTEMNHQPSNKLTDLQPINQCSARQ